VTGSVLYDNSDLEFGIRYATDLLEIGCTKDPVDDFDLSSFRAWCRTRLLRRKK